MRATRAAPATSADAYHEVFRQHPQPILIWDRLNFRILDANAAAVRQYGYPLRRLRTMTVFDIRPPAEAARARRRLTGRRRTFKEARFTHQRSDGTPFDAVINTHFLSYRGRKAALAIVRDVTAQNKESRDLLAAEARLRLLVDAAKDYSFLMLDPGGRIWSWHEGARRLKGYEEGEVFGRHCSLFHTPADVRRGLPARLLRRALRFGRAEERCQIVRKDGSRFPAEVVVTPARDAAGVLRGFARVTRDTTAGDRAAEAVGLSRSIVRAEEAERRRIARELHDGVNQLLAAAKHRVQDAEERLAAGGSPRPVLAEARAVLDSTIQEVRRISQNLRPAALDEFGLKAALAGACADFRRATGARISLDAARLPAALDEETELMLYRITQEALTNAARHAGARRVEVQALRRGPNILLSVRDDGKGFTVAMSGSGLKNIQERAQFLGGRCEIHSRPGAGTRVLVIMPTP